MDRQLEPPILIRSIGSPSKISTLDTYNNLSAFIMSLPPSTSRTQLERLTDALGVECGVVDVSEEERREKERVKRREERRRARRLQREAEEAEAAAADADAGAAGASGALEDEHGQVLGKRERAEIVQEKTRRWRKKTRWRAELVMGTSRWMIVGM